MATALSRTYRPKSLADLLGHETNVMLLQNAAKADRLGQAYIFYGPRGTGKTTTARLIAKLLNCTKRAADVKFRATGEPCNECVPCLEVDGGNSLNVIEIDGASNRGIDEIRNLKESIQTAPVGGGRKVYIIDEAHMLTGAAWNALLKTLEEPPKHATFILATTEYEKIPATIASRAQRFLFKKIPKVLIMEKLTDVAQKEKIAIEPDALELIAAAGEGSFRDAESLLEQVRSFDGKITLAEAERLIGRAGFQKVERLAELIVHNKGKEALVAVAELNEEGQNLVQFTKDLVHYIRKALTLKLNPGLEKIFELDLTKDEIARLGKLAAAGEQQRMLALLRALIRAYGEMRYSPFAMVPLEIAIIENVSG
ncbi:MAG: DNA polymerase III, subunit gamma and tau [Candidatus Liptonbacteria bacterium RIFCSPHIGHO2_01_FULL_57_28]|uniref:DNA polymerase III subunit gamma/tau n=1 Tax=Candidatus Liptonbacteria bacterium RIFCSPHIGHO2_01_FULL_57_28 TaxID=1798647 RepID=A0A1G2CAJ8_9BACT|nr:MAG: DNA polymerase III, subunit gamma and tau [Candidatus Liptonbacteria bacterium RIFCSPHIGHO2_01_FULL_57_28]